MLEGSFALVGGIYTQSPDKINISTMLMETIEAILAAETILIQTGETRDHMKNR